MKETKVENKSDGSTTAVPTGRKSPTVMTDGKEPDDMLLALLNNVLPSMIQAGQAKILGSVGLRNKRKGTMVIIYDVRPDQNGVMKHDE